MPKVSSLGANFFFFLGGGGSRGILPLESFEIEPSERPFPAFPVLESG